MKDPELIIEIPETQEAQAQAPLSSPEGKAPLSSPEGDTIASSQNGETIEAPSGAVGGASGASGASPSGAVGGSKTLRQLKEQASEDDEAPTGTLTLRQIVGGDYLLALVRHYVWFIVLVVLLTCVYVGVRYQCQQDVIEISRLEKELTDAKFRAMSSSSNLTELCRQSNVLKVLSQDEENQLMMPEQPPYIVPVEE